MSASEDDNQRLQQTLGNLLRAGVSASAVVVLLGAVLYLRQSGAQVADYAHFGAGSAETRTIGAELRALPSGDGRALIECGLLLLVATPVARVVLSVAAFAAERDWRYVAVTLVVLAILGFSLVHGYWESASG